MLGSHSIPILFALLPALITATPWYRRETPNSVISDNAESTLVQETSPLPSAGAGATDNGYVSSIPAGSTLVSSLASYPAPSIASTLVSTIPSGVATTDMYGSTILPSGPAATDAYGAPVVDGNAAASPPAYGTSDVSSVATPAVASPALCGNPLGTTYLSQAMVIPNERTRLEWGPAGQVHTGQAGPFMFPLYCGYTNFTVYAWDVGADIKDDAQATVKNCTVTGGNIGLTAPVIILNVMNAAPYFGIVDMGVDKNLTFTGDCMSTVTTLPGTCDVSAAPPADAPAYGQSGEVSSNTTANGTGSTGAESGAGVTSAVSSSVVSDVTSGVTSANATGTPTDMAAGQTGNVTSQGSSVQSTGGSSGGSSVESTGGSSDSTLAQSTGTGVTSGGTSLNATGDATAMGAGQTGNVTSDGLASPTSNGTSGGSSGEPTGEPTDVAAAQSANVTIVTTGGMTYTSNITSIAEPTSVVDNTSGGSSDSSSDESTGGSSGESTGGSTGGTTAQSTGGTTNDPSAESTASPTTDPATAAGATSTSDPADCKHYRVLPGDIDNGKMCYDEFTTQEQIDEADKKMDEKIAKKHPSS